MADTAGQHRSEHAHAREAEARDEFARTAIGRRVAWVVGIVFACLIVGVPVWGWLAPPASRLGGRDVYDMFEGASGARRQGTVASRVAGAWRAASGGAFDRLLAANAELRDELDAATDDVAKRSPILSVVGQPLTRWFVLGAGASTERVHPGTDGVLFYRPAVDALTGPGFLSERALAARGAEGDPRPAIAAFAKLCAEHGAKLVIVPVPGKAAVHPDRLSAAVPAVAAPVRNPSWDAFVADVRALGVTVVDVAADLTAASNGGAGLQYLRTDTHWTPAAMALTATRVADVVRGLGVLPERGPAGFQSRDLEVSAQGDLARILDVPPGDPTWGKETVHVRAVLDAAGVPWRTADHADVLLLGDSFTNIYADERMRWGRAAGFAEQLAFTLDRPLDRVARNDDGAFATRRELARERARGRDRLTGKRVVIWEFAARELAVGRWPVAP